LRPTLAVPLQFADLKHAEPLLDLVKHGVDYAVEVVGLSKL
jgi:hypothetical protein